MRIFFKYARGAGWKFDDVYSAAARLGIKAPFSLVDADRIAGTITENTRLKAHTNHLEMRKMRKEGEINSDSQSILETLENAKLKLTDEDGFWSESTIAQLTGASKSN